MLRAETKKGFYFLNPWCFVFLSHLCCLFLFTVDKSGWKCTKFRPSLLRCLKFYDGNFLTTSTYTAGPQIACRYLAQSTAIGTQILVFFRFSCEEKSLCHLDGKVLASWMDFVLFVRVSNFTFLKSHLHASLESRRLIDVHRGDVKNSLEICIHPWDSTLPFDVQSLEFLQTFCLPPTLSLRCQKWSKKIFLSTWAAKFLSNVEFIPSGFCWCVIKRKINFRPSCPDSVLVHTLFLALFFLRRARFHNKGPKKQKKTVPNLVLDRSIDQNFAFAAASIDRELLQIKEEKENFVTLENVFRNRNWMAQEALNSCDEDVNVWPWLHSWWNN